MGWLVGRWMMDGWKVGKIQPMMINPAMGWMYGWIDRNIKTILD